MLQLASWGEHLDQISIPIRCNEEVTISGQGDTIPWPIMVQFIDQLSAVVDLTSLLQTPAQLLPVRIAVGDEEHLRGATRGVLALLAVGFPGSASENESIARPVDHL